MADFTNTTGDPVFDDAVKQALTVELAQSPFLNLLPEPRVQRILRMMGRSSEDRITPDVAREVCLRAGAKALLAGSVSRLGSHYVVNLDASACSDGQVLAKASRSLEQGRCLEGFEPRCRRPPLQTGRVPSLGSKIRRSHRSDHHFAGSPAELQHGCTNRGGQGRCGEHPLHKRALEDDPQFAMAYAVLARRYTNLDQPSLALENAAEAYTLRDRVTEREQLVISAMYFRTRGDLEKLAETFELWKASYPRDSMPHGSLCASYGFLGQYEKALVECQEALRLDPENVVNYLNLTGIYFDLDRIEDAQKTCDQAVARKLTCPDLYYLAFFQRDSAKMAQLIKEGTGAPGAEDFLLAAQSDTEAYFGRLQHARDFSRRAVDSAVRSGLTETAALWRIKAALREAEFGEYKQAKQGVSEALNMAQGRDVKVLGAMALARIGETSQAKELLRQLQRTYPSSTHLKVYWFPVITAAVALKEHNLPKAFALLQTVAPYELAQPSPNETGTLYPIYLRRQAYLSEHNGNAAAAEFRKILDHPGILVNFETGALARLQLARAYSIAGEPAEAKTAYNDFLSLWQEGDSDIPILVAAKSKSARLKGLPQTDLAFQ